MANEPDHLVLVQLREIRVTLAERFAQVDERFAQMDKRFDQLDKRFEDFHALTSHTLMLGTTNSLKSQELERRYEFAEGEQRRMRERMNEFESRLSRVEENQDRGKD